jgi:tRNA modification GTPase
VAVTLSDTAGVRAATSPVEALGVERSLAALEGAPLVLWVVDGTERACPPDPLLGANLDGRTVVIALTKSDLPHASTEAEVTRVIGGPGRRVVRVSAVTGDGLDALRSALRAALGADRAGGLSGAVANPRHTDALTRSRDALGRAAEAAERGEPGEIVALELRDSLAALGEVTGRNASEELLERIFARFCIGK